jgi:hypothetical protein
VLAGFRRWLIICHSCCDCVGARPGSLIDKISVALHALDAAELRLLAGGLRGEPAFVEVLPPLMRELLASSLPAKHEEELCDAVIGERGDEAVFLWSVDAPAGERDGDGSCGLY